MFSQTDSIIANSITPNENYLFDILFAKFINDNGFEAGLICSWDDSNHTIQLLSTYGFDRAPFVSNKKESISSFVELCLSQHPAPHCHKVKDLTLWNDISSIAKTDNWHPRALFLPGIVKDRKFVAIAFVNISENPKVTPDLSESCRHLFSYFDMIGNTCNLKERMRVMEIFVREVGHDIASSVQAIISKTSVIRRGIVKGKAIIKRIEEIEDEILSTYRVAENLGITVDPDYNIQSGDVFRAVDIVDSVMTQCRSEADERHIELRKKVYITDASIWGDKKALQNALMHYLLNAIKYAKGSSYITLSIEDEGLYTAFSVSNIGQIIPVEDRMKIWNFGWRGSKAKELHVNGSGIGLFTVKKIISAHNGTTSLQTTDLENRFFEYTKFIFKIPKDLSQKLAILNRT